MIRTALNILAERAHQRGWTDRQWAAAAGIRHETLSRVKRRGQCDSATLEALARACGFEVGVDPTPAGPVTATADGLFPQTFDRLFEERLLALCASGTLDAHVWRQHGPGFFVAGLAFLLACQDDFDHAGYLALAESLHPGIGSHDAFRLWLRRSPVKPYRFLPALRHLRNSERTTTAEASVG